MQVERPSKKLEEGHLGSSSGVKVVDIQRETTNSDTSALGHQILHGSILLKCDQKEFVKALITSGP